MDRFLMAKALVERAAYHRNSIGDHGDPYEESLSTGEITLELKIIIKEIFDHLRSALDYCAREVSELSLGYSPEKPVYFPIVSHDFDRKNFRSVMGKLIPGLLQNKPELEGVFESFQAFASEKNRWISDFATLCNENKHEQLSISQRTSVAVEFSKDRDGKTIFSIEKKQNTRLRELPLMMIDNYPEGGGGKCEFLCIVFEYTGDEILGFMDECIEGVRNIISTLSVTLKV